MTRVPHAATILTRESWLNRYNGNVMDMSIVGEPRQETAPGGITDALCQLPILNQVAYLEVFIGNQIVRCDERVCRLAGKIFTLPVDFQIRLCQLLDGLSCGSSTLFCLRESLTMKLLQPLLGLAIDGEDCLRYCLQLSVKKAFKPMSMPTWLPVGRCSICRSAWTAN